MEFRMQCVRSRINSTTHYMNADRSTYFFMNKFEQFGSSFQSIELWKMQESDIWISDSYRLLWFVDKSENMSQPNTRPNRFVDLAQALGFRVNRDCSEYSVFFFFQEPGITAFSSEPALQSIARIHLVWIASPHIRRLCALIPVLCLALNANSFNFIQADAAETFMR